MSEIKAGGPDMPEKTDMYDWTTPSGAMPTVIPIGLWKAAQKQGFDMRWYVVAGPMPRS